MRALSEAAASPVSGEEGEAGEEGGGSGRLAWLSQGGVSTSGAVPSALSSSRGVEAPLSGRTTAGRFGGTYR